LLAGCDGALNLDKNGVSEVEEDIEWVWLLITKQSVWILSLLILMSLVKIGSQSSIESIPDCQ
jgi:hypothetical protein